MPASPRSFLALTLLASLSLAACSDDSEPGQPCPDVTWPSFRVSLTSEGETLPADLRIEITYGAGREIFELDDDTRANKAVFCRTEPEGAAEAEEVVCDLWTSGAASLKVTATGYATIDETLSAERDECGIKLTEVSRVLEKEKTDGGT